MDCRKGPETKTFHPGLVNLSSNFRKMAAFNWLPDFRSNAPSSFIYDLYGASRVVLQCTNHYTNHATTILMCKLLYINITSTIQQQSFFSK